MTKTIVSQLRLFYLACKRKYYEIKYETVFKGPMGYSCNMHAHMMNCKVNLIKVGSYNANHYQTHTNRYMHQIQNMIMAGKLR